jgi:hypothetical protein
MPRQPFPGFVVSIREEECCGSVAIVAALQPDLITSRLPDGRLVDLASLPHTERAGRAEAARQTSAALAAWRGPQANRTARVLARAAAVDPTRPRGPAGAATVVLLARTGRAGPATTDLGRELDRSIELIRAHHTAVGAYAEAERLARDAGLAPVAAARAAGRVKTAVRAAERIIDHGRDG